MNENTCQELTDLLKGEPLEAFDVREHVFAQVKEDLQHDIRIYDSCDSRDSCNKFLIRTAIGKKWADGINYDYDASYFANLIYKAAFFPSGDITPSDSSKYEYYISVHDRCFRGDTMNSWNTTLIEYFRLFGNQHLKYLTKNEKERNKDKWRVPDVCPEELAKDFGANWSYVGWADFLSIPEVYADHPLPPYITDFMKVVYTIGNFIPVPLAPNFNLGRSRLCHDYWDLTLLAIYRHYEKNNEDNSESWRGLLSREGVKHWLDRYGSWGAFVEGNFLQDFVEQEGNGYGKPKELWAGHFDGGGLPKNEEQFKAFFTNSTEWITARGTRIAAALAKSRGSSEEPESNAGEGSI